MSPLPEGTEAEKLAAEVAERWEVPTAPWLREIRRHGERGELEPEFPLEIYAVRIGEGVLTGVPMEPFARVGLSIAERLAQVPVFFGGCMGGWIGYFPTADEHEAGGYEVEPAPVVYGLLTSWLSPTLPEIANAVVEGTVELVLMPSTSRPLGARLRKAPASSFGSGRPSQTTAVIPALWRNMARTGPAMPQPMIRAFRSVVVSLLMRCPFLSAATRLAKRTP